MASRANTVAFNGIEAMNVDVQVTLSSGLPAFTIVGLPDKTVAESKERVRAALESMGISLPPKRITVNLAPADILKEGSHFDLPIALGILSEMNVIPADQLAEYIVMGELALDGGLNHISGVLPTAMAANARDLGLICPAACGSEALWAGDMSILAPSNLLELINHFKGSQVLSQPEPLLEQPINSNALDLDMSDIKGQESAKRALEIAAAGGHNLLLLGPPGAGKSMLASRLPGILPAMDAAEALETTMVHSLSGSLKSGSLIRERPYRSPHHSASLPALVGGGAKAKPGEVSLAHNGVLFLDELPEFNRSALESLRQPLESRVIHVARANNHISYPANVQLITAMNPCKCGYLADAERACTRAPRCGKDYQAKISGPLLDRIDIHIEVSDVSARDLTLPKSKETSKDVRARVNAARAIQAARYKDHNLRVNAEADGNLLEEVTQIDAKTRTFLADAIDKLRLSARGYHRILRVARTIADLEGAKDITQAHIGEALSLRRLSFS